MRPFFVILWLNRIMIVFSDSNLSPIVPALFVTLLCSIVYYCDIDCALCFCFKYSMFVLPFLLVVLSNQVSISNGFRDIQRQWLT